MSALMSLLPLTVGSVQPVFGRLSQVPADVRDMFRLSQCLRYRLRVVRSIMRPNPVHTSQYSPRDPVPVRTKAAYTALELLI